MAPGKPDNQHLPDDLVELLETRPEICVLTGAGVSAESGVPTFRDAQTGLWAKFDPLSLASPEGFAEDPATVWKWYSWRRELISRVEPNDGHRALAGMQDALPGLTLVTQNVDGLHQAAGARDVLELHGNIRRTICSRTRREIPAEWLEAHSRDHPPPSPHDPEGLARPDVVWFGEALDREVLEAALEAADRCRLCIVAGTAGTVEPAASIPRVAARAGARVVDINPEVTEIGRAADWHLEGTSATWLPRIAAALSGSPGPG